MSAENNKVVAVIQTPGLGLAFLAHLLFMLLVLLGIPLTDIYFQTPFGTTSTVIFPGVCAHLLIGTIAKRFGFLQTIGVLASSSSVTFALHYGGFKLMAADYASATVSLVIISLSLHFLKDRFDPVKLFFGSVAVGSILGQSLWALVLQQPSVIIPSAYVDGVIFMILVTAAIVANKVYKRAS